jgi:hypothetical protein
MFEFLSIIALVLLLGLAFFVTVTLHELGHAIPALLMTKDEVTIYIGSIGSPYNSFHLAIGRLEFYCKYRIARDSSIMPDYFSTIVSRNNEQPKSIPGVPALRRLDGMQHLPVFSCQPAESLY